MRVRILNTIEQLCNQLNTTTLTKFAFLIGAKQGTKKLIRINNIIHQFNKLAQHNHDTSPTIITSIDTGIVNCSITSLLYQNKQLQLLYWDKINLEQRFNDGLPMVMNPEDTSRIINLFIRDLLRNPIINRTKIFTIEKQRTRTLSSSIVTDPILKLNLVEHLIYDKLSTQFNKCIESSDPARMTKFMIPTTISADKSTNSKRLRIDLVKSMIFQRVPSLITLDTTYESKLIEYNNTKPQRRRTRSDSIFDMLQLHEPMNGVRKDDDLTDSLLHAISWTQWFNTYNELNQLFHRSGMPSSSLCTYIDTKYDQWQHLLIRAFNK